MNCPYFRDLVIGIWDLLTATLIFSAVMVLSKTAFFLDKFSGFDNTEIQFKDH